jgi:DNA-binding NarL/FixJ family response regulator
MTIRVALVDDAADLRMLVRLQLEIDGRFDVVGEAADGVQGLSVIEEHGPDLVLLDIAMPEMDGLEVLQELRRRAWVRPVVVFSGFASTSTIEQAMALGATAYLKKGTDIHAVPDLLVAAMGSASPG